MKKNLLALLLSAAAAAAAAEAVAPAKPAANLPLRARLTEDVIKQAVRDTRAEQPAEGDATPSGQVLRGDRAQAFARAFTYAQKPSCMGSDALKLQPSEIYTKNWYFSASGWTALPIWAAAVVNGKCK